MAHASFYSARLLVAGTLLFAAPAFCAEPRLISASTTWAGEVLVPEDTRVLPGATLTIEAGAKIKFARAQSTKTDPQFWSPDTELSVEGELKIQGTPQKPVTLEPEEGQWGGIILDKNARAKVENASVVKAGEAFLVNGATLDLSNVCIKDSEYGLVLGPGAMVTAKDTVIDKAEKAIIDLRQAGATPLSGIKIQNSSDADLLAKPADPTVYANVPGLANLKPAREFLGEHTVMGDETWEGDIVISQKVTVPPGSKLTLAPGTRVAFRFFDTNSDGLGEGELLVLGSIRSQGTKDRPVVFDSAEEHPGQGAWDKVSIISSDDAENSFVHTRFSHGQMALHSHYSSFTAKNCEFEDNLRGLQFQECPKAVVEDCEFKFNKQALRFRDSGAQITGNSFDNNLYAVHAMRSEVKFEGNTVENTVYGGILAKECKLKAEKNRFASNRTALGVKGEDTTLDFNRNKVLATLETALSFSEGTGSLTGNGFDGAGLDLIGANYGKLTLRGNTLGKSGRDAIHLKGPADVDARNNSWLGEPKKRIFDGDDKPGLGKVLWDPPTPPEE